MLTLLAPAKNYEIGVAAIQAGADAVYIGAPKFGARQAAGNSVEEIQRLVDYARPFGVKVLVTLNTLLYENERAEALTIAEQLWNTGIDAIIVQDLWLMQQLIERGYRVHASTQCDNRDAEQVRKMRDMGCRRVVLARELGIDEIRAIHEAVPDIELEAFVHGALCVSFSGCCYMSEVLCGRSANRGACAQYCRMRYDLLDASGREVLDDHGEPIHQRYLLSLQDMDRSMHLHELIEAGVTTFKIEGRLKDADYVTNVVAYYRQLLSAKGIVQSAKCSSVESVYNYDFVPNPEKTFHRGGIDYFLHGRTPHMANFETPKSTGEQTSSVGFPTRGNRAQYDLRLLPDVELHTGDGLTIRDFGFSVNKIEKLSNGMTRITANKALPIEGELEGVFYRNFDIEFQRHLHAERHIPVDILFEETPTGFRLTIGDHSQEFYYPHEPAKNEERALQTIHEQIVKLGDTLYIARNVRVRTQPYFIPISVLNDWRRTVLKS